MATELVTGSSFRFDLIHIDAGCAARRSMLTTPHGNVALPGFMPVGTQGTVKGLTVQQLGDTGAHMVLGNTYHLAMRPGEEVVRQLGGLHEFMGWAGPILTDSGGFQLFSLAAKCRVTEERVVFRSHIDGHLFELSPERCMRIQQALGSDFAMVLDHVVALPNDETVVRDACDRTVRWAERCQAVSTHQNQAVLAIVQGGLSSELRVSCAQQLIELNFDGYAIGGLSVGEEPTQMYPVVSQVCEVLPAERPRYLMGVGRPQDLLESIRRGVDLFDCVLPTRNGRNGLAFTDKGTLRLRNRQHQSDRKPLDRQCPCAACRHSRGYLRHLFMANEMLGPILLSLHNLTYYQTLMRDAREAIEADRFESFYQQKMGGWHS